MTEATTVAVSETSPYKPYTSPEGKTYVPIMEQFKTPAGLEFDANRHTSQETLQKRGEALDKMAEIVHDFEPQTAENLPHGQSYEYTSSWIVQKTENPQLKADVAIVWIGEMVEEGDYARAVDGLLYGGVPEANIPEMQNANYVGGLFEAAQQEGDTFQAHRIAQRVANLEESGEIGNLFKTPVEGSKFNERWEARERTLYEKQVTDTLDKASKMEGFDWDTYQDVQMAYQGWNFREDGYYNDSPHPLAIDTARAYCKLIVEQGADASSVRRAYEVAIESKLPQADLAKYEAGLPRAQQIKARIGRHLSNLSQKVQ